MKLDMIIHDGTLVTDSRAFEGNIGIKDGKISQVTANVNDLTAEIEIDASKCLVMPGIVDPHVHIHDMFSIDSYESATRAAARGGVTTVIDFAWQAWEGETSAWDTKSTLLEGIERKQEKAEDAYIDYSLHGGITRPNSDVLAELPEAIDRGVTSFKMFTAYEIGLPNGFINRVLETVADLDAVAVFHTEDGSVCEELTNRFRREGREATKWYPQSRPPYAEAMAAEDAVRMATEAGCKYYGVHTSCEDAAEILETFRKRYPSLVRAETCTHYIAHDDSVYDALGNLPMIAPPIRSPEDIDSVFNNLERGSLDVVSTDHCAFKRADKQGGKWWEISFGVNSLQTSLPVFHELAVNQRGFSYPFLVSVLSTNPARLFGLPEKGTLDPGTDADIVIFDPKSTDTIEASRNESRADYSLYDGWEVSGRVETTIVRGERIVEKNKVTSDPGYGSYVERAIPSWSH